VLRLLDWLLDIGSTAQTCRRDTQCCRCKERLTDACGRPTPVRLLARQAGHRVGYFAGLFITTVIRPRTVLIIPRIALIKVMMATALAPSSPPPSPLPLGPEGFDRVMMLMKVNRDNHGHR